MSGRGITRRALERATARIEGDLASSTRHWREVKASTEARLAEDKARMEHELAVCNRKLAALARGEHVSISFAEEEEGVR